MKHIAVQSAAPHLYQANGELAVFATVFHQAVLKRLKAAACQDAQAEKLWLACDGVLNPKPEASADLWQPELGMVLARLGSGDVLLATVQILLALHAQGRAGEWQVALPATHRFSMAGQVFQLEGKIKVQAIGDAVRIIDEKGDALSFEKIGKVWQLNTPSTPDPKWQYAGPVYLQHAEMTAVYLQNWQREGIKSNADIIIDWPKNQFAAANEQHLQACLAATDQAFALLASIDPAYLPWIKPLLRGICVTPMPEPEEHNSGSNIFHAGVVSCGYPISVAYLAEAIVHEVSHQHFHLLNSVIPFVKKESSAEMYYSSLKRQMRPLFLVLLAFHATANMCLYWCDLLKMQENGAHRRELQAVLGHTENLASQLWNNPHLSETGEALFMAQIGLLNQRGLNVCPKS